MTVNPICGLHRLTGQMRSLCRALLEEPPAPLVKSQIPGHALLALTRKGSIPTNFDRYVRAAVVVPTGTYERDIRFCGPAPLDTAYDEVRGPVSDVAVGPKVKTIEDLDRYIWRLEPARYQQAA